MKKSVSYLCLLLLLFGLISGCVYNRGTTSPDLVPSPNLTPNVDLTPKVDNSPDINNTPDVKDGDVTDNARETPSPKVSPAS